MSNMYDMPGNQRPIQKVERDVRSIKHTLNTIIIETQSIKSDLKQILQYFDDEKKKEDQLLQSQVSNQDKGWFFTY